MACGMGLTCLLCADEYINVISVYNRNHLINILIILKPANEHLDGMLIVNFISQFVGRLATLECTYKCFPVPSWWAFQAQPHF